MMGHLRQFPIRHWQGRVALWPTLLLTLIALRLTLSSLTRLRPPDWPLPLCATLTAISAAVLLWQVIGTLRALRNSDGLGVAAGGLALAFSLALFATAELDSYAARAAVKDGLTPIEPLPVSGTTMQVAGTLDWPLYARFCTTLIRNPGIATVSLDSEGGRVPVGRAMALRIGERGLDTRADGLCASACVLAFMGGAGRSLGPGGALGFHGYSLFRYDPFQTVAEEEARDKAWLVARGVDPGFVEQAFAIGADTLWRPDTGALRAAGVLTDRPAAPPLSDFKCEALAGHAARP